MSRPSSSSLVRRRSAEACWLANNSIILVGVLFISFLDDTNNFPTVSAAGSYGTDPYQHHQQQQDQLGTTLVAIRFPGGVVVGADTRTSSSSMYVSADKTHKIVPLSHHAVVARSGSAAATQQLAARARAEQQTRAHRYFSDFTACDDGFDDDNGEDSTPLPTTTTTTTTTITAPKNNPLPPPPGLSVSHLAVWLSNQTHRQHQQQQSNNSDNDASMTLLVAGLDPPTGQAQIYSIAPSGALVQEQKEYAAEGSGSVYALGFLDQHYAAAGRRQQKPDQRPRHQLASAETDTNETDKEDNENNDNDEEEAAAMELCRRAIEGAMHRDARSGGFIRLHSVTAARGRRELAVWARPMHPNMDESASSFNQKQQQQSGGGVELAGFASSAAAGKGRRE